MASKTTDTTITTKRRRLAVPDDLLARVLSFCDASEHIAVLRASQRCFSNALGVHLADASSLALSFLLRTYPNVLQNNDQHEVAIQILMSLLLSASENREEKALKHLELANLRWATGRGWFSQLSIFPIVTLDLSNCVRFDENLLLDFLQQGPSTLRHLHLTGCSRVTPQILQPLQTERHSQLRSLSIGSCSQTIRTEFIFSLLRNLRNLEHLNLQGLTHVHDYVSADENEDSFADLLPDSLKSINVTGMRSLKLKSRDALETLEFLHRKLNEMVDMQQEVLLHPGGVEAAIQDPRLAAAFLDTDKFCWHDAPEFRIKMEILILDGLVGVGINACALSNFSLGRKLREVHLAGCSSINSAEICALAYNCRQTLTCFQMRGGTIDKEGLEALAKHCQVLAEIDLSACMELGDEEIIKFCKQSLRSRVLENESSDDNESNSSHRHKRRRSACRSSLKVLRLAAIRNLTDASIEAISLLDSLLVLDVHDCLGLTPAATYKAVKALPLLVEVNAKDIANGSPTLTKLLRSDPVASKGLTIVNEKIFKACNHDARRCCSARSQSQRLNASVPPQSMYHCVDCNLIPSIDRGVCVECVEKCHSGHKTYLGSFTRFYCDCPFGSDAGSNRCEAIFPETSIA
jgi:hypothetical protein